MKSLLAQAQQGDAAAFEQLFLPHEAQLYRIAFLYTKNEADALDVMQETALRAYQNLGTVQQPEYLKTWLVRIAINCALDAVRQRRRFLPLEQDVQTEPVSEQQEEEILQRVTLHQLLNDLSPQEKTVILLRYYGDMTLAQIAAQQKLPPGTVKSILYRALKKLNEKMKEDRYA